MTFRLTPEMSEALREGQSPLAPLVEVALPDYTLRHLVGSGEVMFVGSGAVLQKFMGRDPMFGVLVSAGNLQDGVGNEAPDWDLTFAVPDNATVEELTDAMAQGGEVNGWLGVIDRTTGLLLPDPIQLFAGELDVPRLRVGKGSMTVEWRCVSALEVFHDREIGARLSDAHQRSVWPGEMGLANMSGIEKTSFWGMESPPSAITYGGGGAGGGGLRASDLLGAHA